MERIALRKNISIRGFCFLRSMNCKPHTHTQREGQMVGCWLWKWPVPFRSSLIMLWTRGIRSLFTDNVEEAFRVETDKHSWCRICMIWEKAQTQHGEEWAKYISTLTSTVVFICKINMTYLEHMTSAWYVFFSVKKSYVINSI